MLHSHYSKMYKQYKKSNGNSIEFSLSTWTWSGFKSSWLESYKCRTLQQDQGYCLCIYNIQKSNRNSIEFSLLTQPWSRFKLSWLEPYKSLCSLQVVTTCNIIRQYKYIPERKKTTSSLFLWFLYKHLAIPHSLQFLNSCAECNISLVLLTFNITSLKTLTGPFVEGHEDIKC